MTMPEVSILLRVILFKPLEINMKKTLWVTSIYLFLSAMPVGADHVDGATHSEAGIANEPSGVFVNFVTSASGATPITL